MEKLQKAYDAVEMLEALGLPVSSEQRKAIADMEEEYLNTEVIPLLKQELEPFVAEMKHGFRLEVIYQPQSGLVIGRKKEEALAANRQGAGDKENYRKKQYIIRVTFPNSYVSCEKMVWKTLLDVVRYAGAENVRKLGIMLLGDNFISTELSENSRYAAGQKEIEPGLYVNTYSDTKTKLEQIKTINRELRLNLTVEKVMLSDNMDKSF